MGAAALEALRPLLPFANGGDSDMKNLIKRATNFHISGSKPDIFIFSTPRSGSTHLVALFMTQRGIRICEEPFDARNPEKRKAMGVNGWEDLMPGGGRDARVIRYLQRIRRNQYPIYMRSPLSKQYRFWTNRMVFKILHGAEDMIQTVRETLRSQIVYLVRHPIPVTLSRRELPRLAYFCSNEAYRRHFTCEQLALAERIIHKGSGFERGIVCWCLQNAPCLANPDRPNWVVLTYEELVMDPASCTRHLCRKLDFDDEAAMLRSMDQPSWSVDKSDKETQAFFKESGRDRSWLIDKWRQRVSARQEETAFEILDVFNIDVYTFGSTLPSPEYRIFRTQSADPAAGLPSRSGREDAA